MSVESAASSVFSWLMEQALQQIGWRLFVALIAALGFTAALNRGLDLLKARQQQYWFFGAAFVLSLILVSLLSYQQVPGPDLKGRIEWVGYGGQIDQAPNGPPLVILSVTITNPGQMASIVQAWNLDATIGGQVYRGTRWSVPSNMTLSSDARAGEPSQVKFSNSSLYEKALQPVVAGGLVAGILIFAFPDLNSDRLKNQVSLWSLKFKDVRDREYTAELKHGAEAGRITQTPGIDAKVLQVKP